MFARRMARVREEMAARGLDAVLLSVGADLPYLTGYEAMPLERLTMLVVPRDGAARLVIPRLEAPRVVPRDGVFELVSWDETDDPVELVASMVAGADRLAIGDKTWSRFLVELVALMPRARFERAGELMAALRAIKSPEEIEALRQAAAAVDRIATRLQAGEIPLVGRTEAEVSAELGRQILDEGHQRVNFAIVAAGENAASPHHDAGRRIIAPGEIVLCDFGGTMIDEEAGMYSCSDITRCVHLGPPPSELSELYQVLFEAQAASVASATVGTPCEDVDAAGRSIIAAAGYGEYFVHRTGHGIGVEGHEDPYIVEGNTTTLTAGHAFSVEPGIYVPGKWGARLEDIVVASDDGPDSLNTVQHSLVVVEV